MCNQIENVIKFCRFPLTVRFERRPNNGRQFHISESITRRIRRDQLNFWRPNYFAAYSLSPGTTLGQWLSIIAPLVPLLSLWWRGLSIPQCPTPSPPWTWYKRCADKIYPTCRDKTHSWKQSVLIASQVKDQSIFSRVGLLWLNRFSHSTSFCDSQALPHFPIPYFWFSPVSVPLHCNLQFLQNYTMCTLYREVSSLSGTASTFFTELFENFPQQQSIFWKCVFEKCTWTRLIEVTVLAVTAKFLSVLARSARLQIFATKNIVSEGWSHFQIFTQLMQFLSFVGLSFVCEEKQAVIICKLL